MLLASAGHLIIEVEKNPSESPGGIVLPESAVKDSNKGLVVDHGLIIDEELASLNIGVLDLKGYTVFFPLYSGHKLVHEGKEYLVIKEEDVLAFVDKD